MVLSVAVLGCQSTIQKPDGGGGFDAFKELKVSKGSIPQYEASPYRGWGKRDDGPKIYNVWDTVRVSSVSEEQAKKIMADFITKHQDKNDHILIGVVDENFYYVGEFFKNYDAENNYRGPAKASSYPVIYYRKTPAKG
jgi:hypothetical protein